MIRNGLWRKTQEMGWILVALFIFAQPFGNTFELPIALMALIGLSLLLTQPRLVMVLPAIKSLAVVFACIWLPMLISLVDAVYLSRSLQTTLVFVRFPLMAIFVMVALERQDKRWQLLQVMGWVLCFATIDIIIQSLFGSDLFGMKAHVTGRPSGLLSQRLAIGHILAVLSPIYFFWVWKMSWKKRWLWALAPMIVIAILLSGARVAWIMMAIGLLFSAMFWLINAQSRWKSGLIAVIVLSVAIFGALQNPAFNEKVKVTAGLFSGDYTQANAATSLRLPIWKVATEIFKDHWINGVGPRGFRYAYPHYAPSDDFWMTLKVPDKNGRLVNANVGPTHPHLLILEIIVETGLIGLASYLIAFFYWGRLVWLSAKAHSVESFPWLVAALIAIMPINAHMAFYASFWSCIVWWLIAISLSYWQTEKVRL